MSADDSKIRQRLVERWMQDAHADLLVAGRIGEEWLAPKIAAFHAQQAAEKALKALLTFAQVDFPRTHAIALLLHLCEAAGYDDVDVISDAMIMTRYAVATRYISEDEPVNVGEAQKSLSLAQQVIAWVEAKLHV